MIEKISAKLEDFCNLNKSSRHFKFKLKEKFNFKPGQFVNLFLFEGEKIFRRPFSICNKGVSNSVELCIKFTDGEFTSKLWKKEIGENFEIMGPLGLFTHTKAKFKKFFFIATGTGIAPLRAMIFHILEVEKRKDIEINLLLGGHFLEDILFFDEFKNLEKKFSNFKFIPTLIEKKEEWKGNCGYVQENISKENCLNTDFLICGNPKMIECVKDKLLGFGVLENSIFIEKY